MMTIYVFYLEIVFFLTKCWLIMLTYLQYFQFYEMIKLEYIISSIMQAMKMKLNNSLIIIFSFFMYQLFLQDVKAGLKVCMNLKYVIFGALKEIR